MIATATWNGRRGPVLLGPTEHRVARWLADMTRHGRVTIRTADLASSCRLERSEAYRITRRLRILGLFGIENDQGGTRGGRRYWRTAIEHDAGALNQERHRVAWARLVAWARSTRHRSAARLSTLRAHHHSRLIRGHGSSRRALGPAVQPPRDGGPTFAEAMRRAGLGPLMDAWGVS